MLAILLFAAWIALTLAIFAAHKRWKERRAPATREEGATGAAHSCSSRGGICCGLHEVCEKGLPKRPDESLYYNDEELDRLAGRPAYTYTDTELAELHEVWDTLLPEERAPWREAMRRRRIQLPANL